MTFFTAKQRALIVLLEYGPLQNSHLAERVGITEQYSSQEIASFQREGLVATEFKHPRRIAWLTEKGVEIARHLEQVASLNVKQA